MQNLIAAYKEYGTLYTSQFEWGAIIWRPLTSVEAQLYQGLFATVPKAKAELEDEIFRECVIDHPLPEDEFDVWQAGIVTTVAQQILYFSLVKTPEEFLQRLNIARQQVGINAIYEVYAKILMLFPSYSLNDLKNLPIDTVFELLAIVERTTGEQMEFRPKEEPKPQMPGGFIDFEAENRKLAQADIEVPSGEWNLDRNPGLRKGGRGS